MVDANMTKRLYMVATLGFMVGAAAWGVAFWDSGSVMQAMLGMSNLGLGVMFMLFSRSSTEAERREPPPDSA